MRKSLLTASFLLATLAVNAASIDFTYDLTGSDEYLLYGTKKAETYDIAIKVADPSLVGAKVTKMAVPFPLAKDMASEYSAWMTTELKLDNKKNAPNICSQEPVVENQMLYVTFDEPYTLTEEGVYVGYSFVISEVNSNNPDARSMPIAVQYGETPDGFYLHTSRSNLKWKDQVAKLGAVSCISVTLEGDNLAANAARVTNDFKLFASKESKSVAVTIYNHGTDPINNVEYSYTIGDLKGTGTYALETPLAGIFNLSTNVPLPVEVPETNGIYPISLTIDKVNGAENKDIARTMNSEVEVVPFIPVNRPIVDEYTGLWCGWCPRGYVALETMAEKYGHDFVAMAWHNGDDMEITTRFPNNVSGFPYAYMNRSKGIDPGEIEGLWPKYRVETPVGEIACDLNWADEEHTILKATSSVRFVKDINDEQYRVAFAFVCDGLSDPLWKQSNYYSTQKPGSLVGKYADLFVGTSSSVRGLTFNDVTVYAKDYTGIDGTIPAEIKENVTYTYDYEVPIANMVSTKKKVLVGDGSKVRCIALLFDGQKNFVNAFSSGYVGESSAVNTVNASAELLNTVYYDLAGRRVANPEKGIYIKVDEYSNGVRKSAKVIR